MEEKRRQRSLRKSSTPLKQEEEEVPPKTATPTVNSGTTTLVSKNGNGTLVKSPVKMASNKQLIKNALSHICLAGKVNEAIQADVLEVLHI